MSPCGVTPVVVNLSSKNPNVNIRLLFLLGLIETVSYTGARETVFWACARLCGALSRPNTIGAATVTIPAALSNTFLLKSNLRAARPVMMRAIRFCRSAPVTPDTQVGGELTQNSQIFKIL